MPADRRLAAIMFTDIVGYTSLMNTDEKKAFEHIRLNRRIHFKLIKKYRGRWLKEMGDGILASFQSTVDAALCAVSIQKAVKELGIPLRIGIHLGDVIFEKNDVLGNGVNIASRVQGMADTQGVAISDTVYKDIKNKHGLEIEFVGEKKLKGVDAPVGIFKLSCLDPDILDYHIDTGELIKPVSTQHLTFILGAIFLVIIAALFYFLYPSTSLTSQKNRNSIAVLPLKNLSNDPDSTVFSGGLTEELITHLANVKGLNVKSRNASYNIGNEHLDFREIAKKHNVLNVLDGTVQKTGNMISITLGLINAVTDTYLWKERFDKKLDEIMEIPGEVTKKIVASLDITISTIEKERIEQRVTDNFTAYEYYLRAVHEDRNWTVDGSLKTMEYLEKAIELDPEFSEAYSLYAWQLVQLSASYPVMSTQEALKKALPAAQMAIKYDSLSSDAYIILAAVYYDLKWDFKKAEESFMKSLEYNSWGEAPIYQCYCIIVEYLISNNRLQEAQDIIRNINNNNPADFTENAYLGIMQFGQGNYEEAAKLIEKQLHHSESWILYSLLGIMYHHKGDYKTALSKLEIGLSMTERRPGKILSRMAMAYFRMEQHKDAFEILGELLDRHQQGEYGLAFPIALIYNEMGDEDNTFKWLDIYYENHEAYMLYLGYIDFLNLRNHPRFIALLEKIGFEV